MEAVQLKLLYQTLDDIRHQNGVEYWYARELYPILGYTRWDNFQTPINKAKEACANSGGRIEDHFQDIESSVKSGMDLEKQIPNVKLTRYACYLIALNGNPQKEEIAFAQAYFVTQTRKIEVLMQRMDELERLDARTKLKITEKEFSDMVFARGVEKEGIRRVRSKGDRALFGYSNEDMKNRLGVPPKRALADFLPNVTLKAKDLATAMTTEGARRKNLHGEWDITGEHIANNSNVRGALTKSGICPENLPPAEDIRQLELKHRKEMKVLQEKQQIEMIQATKKLNGGVELKDSNTVG
jgi:DNA-damage-inducible protein D